VTLRAKGLQAELVHAGRDSPDLQSQLLTAAGPRPGPQRQQFYPVFDVLVSVMISASGYSWESFEERDLHC
jgi:hypothetical protein